MGPRALKVRSICLWSCLKRSSLQNFTRLTQPLLPVWGISSKLRTCPSTALFLNPFLPSNFSSTTVPAAVTQSALRNVMPQSRFLDPQVPCALTHTVTRVDMLLMARHSELWHPSLSCSTDYVPPPSPASYPWLRSISVMNWWFMDVKVTAQVKHNTDQMFSYKTHTDTSDRKKKECVQLAKRKLYSTNNAKITTVYMLVC